MKKTAFCVIIYYGFHNITTSGSETETFVVNYVNTIAVADALAPYVAKSSPTMTLTTQDSGLYGVVVFLSISPIKAYLKLNSPRYQRGTICLTLIQIRKCTRVAHAMTYDDVIKWKHFSGCWTFVRGFQRPPVNSTHKGQWRGAWMFSLICAQINGWVNNGEAGDLRHHRAHYDPTVMLYIWCK